MKDLFTRKEVENLFEEVILDIKKNCSTKRRVFYIGERKIGTIRYFLSIRLDSMLKIKKLIRSKRTTHKSTKESGQ